MYVNRGKEDKPEAVLDLGFSKYAPAGIITVPKFSIVQLYDDRGDVKHTLNNGVCSRLVIKRAMKRITF